MMCHRPVDSLPLSRSVFSGSWTGIFIGVVIVVGLVMWVNAYQGTRAKEVARAVVVITPTKTPTLTPLPTATATPLPPTATATFTPSPTVTPQVYIIQPGDTLLYVAQLYGVPLNVLTNFNNNINSSFLNVGQEILIPPRLQDTSPGEGLPDQIVYVVESGDTISSIAYELGTTIEKIVNGNPGENLDIIFPGQEIIVPLSSPTVTPTATPLPTATTTPGPRYPLPDLLSPPDGARVEGDSLLFNWTATLLLAADEYYVVSLQWPNGQTSEYWLKNSSLRLSKADRPTNGNITWSVHIAQRSGQSPQGGSTGIRLSASGQRRVVQWP